MVVRRRAQGWAAAGLMAGLWLTGNASAQTTTAPPLVLPAAKTVQAAPAALAPAASAPGSSAAAAPPPVANAPGSPATVVVVADAPCADGGYWAGIPPIQAIPRPGEFVVPPTGEGYYSLLDVIQDNYRQGPPKYPYPRTSICPGTFFDLDWSYLDKPDNEEHDWADCLKRIKFFDDTIMFTTGGEIRIREMNEVNSRLTGHGNNYQLERERIYGDLWITNRFRVFVEFIDASTFNQDLPPLAIDRNKTDFQNAFIDVRTLDIADSPLWVRAGRQELLYGSQRLISPLDWANTRRTFQGIKAFWQNEEFSFDAFCVQPIIPDPNKLDSPDNTQIFSGGWATYRPEKGQTIDLYYLNLNHDGNAYTGSGGVKGSGNISTFGSRYAGDYCGWMWDFEGMLQCGYLSNQDLFAGAYTVSAGYNFKDLPLNPQVWIGYDWASGTSHPGTNSDNSTFQQLFPFGHYYFGFIDDVGRQNINDLSQQLTLYPTNWITAQVQNHIFHLDSATDALYSAGGTALRRDPTGKAGNYVGDEIDLTMNFHLSKHQDILVGYSHLYAGGFIQNAPTVAAPPKGSSPASRAVDPELFYVQYSFKW